MASVKRRPVALSALVACAVLLGACGKGGYIESVSTSSAGKAPKPSSASGGPAHTSTITPSEPAPKATSPARAQALAFARAVNLSAGDVPGFTPSQERGAQQETALEKRLGRELHACAGTGAEGDDLAEASSREFERKASLIDQAVNSQVTVSTSAAVAAKELQTLRSQRVRGCLSHYFYELLSRLQTHGLQVSGISTKYGLPPTLGTAGGFAVRVTARLEFHRIAIPFYLDYLAFVEGPAQVSLRALGTPMPFPSHLEEHLFTLLAERAKAHTA
jgi:hypothetical protein